MTAMAVVPVPLSDQTGRGYDIWIESGLLSSGGGHRALPVPAHGVRVLVLSDETVWAHYGQRLYGVFKAAELEPVVVLVPPGEQSKSLAQAQRIYEAAMAAQISRGDWVLALGGGVVGDLAGFVAATYHRGLDIVQVPTSLVAQVDSAIGGKTAVNVGGVKNSVGVFHQPQAVWVDPEVLATLPERELQSGLAEVVKYGLIETTCMGESGLFDWLEASADRLSAYYPEMIQRCVQIKARVVSQDERETQGLRYVLNLGHTFGHAYETLSHYRLLHGEAVAIGLVKATQLACLLGEFPESALGRLMDLLGRLGLGATVQQAQTFEPAVVFQAMRQDKKNRHGRLRLILPAHRPGQVRVADDIPESAVLDALQAVVPLG